jgi:hypothetical protein
MNAARLANFPAALGKNFYFNFRSKAEKQQKTLKDFSGRPWT